MEINEKHLVIGDNGHNLVSAIISPSCLIAFLDRKITQHPNHSCISLEILYRGDVELTQTNALNVFWENKTTLRHFITRI